MAKRYNLSADPRTVIGKQVKQLRRQQMLPANVYGHKVDATAVTISLPDFKAVFKQAGETGLIDLQVNGEAQTRPVLIHDTLVDPMSDALLHVDFYQVNLKEKLVATVPLEFVGESPIVKASEGILLELLQEVEVESLPTDIPSVIEVDISGLTEVDQGIKVGDLSLPTGVTMQTDVEELVCKIDTAQMSEEEAGETPEAEGEAADGGESAETSETETGNE
jgi:large subunit ribosomal protein L25